MVLLRLASMSARRCNSGAWTRLVRLIGHASAVKVRRPLLTPMRPYHWRMLVLGHNADSLYVARDIVYFLSVRRVNHLSR